MKTAAADIELLAPGMHVTVRDEQWLVRAVETRGVDGTMVRCIGTSELVRDREATFFTDLDRIEPMQPDKVRLVTDGSPGFRRSRLFLEALLRKTPLPAGETRLAVGHRQLLAELDYQKRPAQMALDSLRPRLLVADAVGLGKTLEVGMVLSELIRRGRGDRILVVTPRHILAQFQHELWTRFAVPLVRLDSEGIQRVRQRIPSNRNPFSFYKRVIISIDTLKNPGRYRHHLEGIHWDVAVFDECHNLVNSGSLNNELARVVAPNTRALILTSATPHNGDQRSFARLVDLLDPTAIVDSDNFTADDIAHLFIRRHKATEEVSAEVGSQWAARTAPKPIVVEASAAENAVFDELAATWLRPVSGEPPTTGKGRQLFPYTLLKAALSSHVALAETIRERRTRLAGAAGDGVMSDAHRREDESLARLEERNDAVGDEDSTKLAVLRDELAAVGVGAKSSTRAVIFSERVPTLNWLRERLPALTGLKPDQVVVMHGGCSDLEQQEIVEQFALEGSKIRLLVTGDIASEGVNLHRQCHHLIHYDLPWSLIRLEQRNGRIDRYGQTDNPEIRALLLTPSNPEVRGDVTVLTRLLAKEHNAHLALGDAASVMGLHSVKSEEEAVMKALRDASSDDKQAALDAVVPDDPSADSFDFALFLAGGPSRETIATLEPASLFVDDEAFLREALYEVSDDPAREFDIREDAAHSLLSLVPPPDLVRRLEVLPQSYLKERGVTERLKLTSDRDVAEHMLAEARRSDESIWPEVGFLSSQHPIMDWVADKVLVQLGRNEAPVIVCDVSEPTFLLQGLYSNRAGEPTAVEWIAVEGLDGVPVVNDDMFDALRAAGVDHRMANMSTTLPDATLTDLAAMVPRAVDVGREHMENRREDLTSSLDSRIARYRERLAQWKARRSEVIERIGSEPQRIKAVNDMKSHVRSTEEHIDSLRTEGAPLVRVVAVLISAT